MLRAERADRRASLAVFVAENRLNRLGAKAGVLMQDQQRFDEWVIEKGEVFTRAAYGSEGWYAAKGEAAPRFMVWFAGQVASGVPAREICGHYMQDEGLLGAFLAEDATRVDMYQRALRWVADGYVADAVGIADDATMDGLGVAKLQIDTRLKVAEKLDPVRFGKQEGGLGGALENLADVLQRISERKRAPQTLDVTDAQVVE